MVDRLHRLLTSAATVESRAEEVKKIRGNIYTEITRYATNLLERSQHAFDRSDVKTRYLKEILDVTVHLSFGRL